MINTIDDAIQLASSKHYGQKDKVGDSYLLHLFRVMLKMKTEEEMMVAVLHDIVEDTSMTCGILTEHGYSSEIVQAVWYLTRLKDEPYSVFIRRIAWDSLAKRVKIADIQDHLEQNALTGVLSEEAVARYQSAIDYLTVIWDYNHHETPKPDYSLEQVGAS